MNLMGIDIGYDRCGFAIMDFYSGSILDCGIIVTQQKNIFPVRLKNLREDLSFLKDKYCPEYISVESLFFYRKNSTFEKICMAKGILFELFNDISIIEVQPAKLKKFITGYGNSTKSTIKWYTKNLLGYELEFSQDDVYDALALVMYLKDYLTNKD